VKNSDSGAETISGQGGQDRGRQSREREIKVFAGLGAFFVPKMAQDTSLGVGKSRPGGTKISPRGEAAPLPPYFPRL